MLNSKKLGKDMAKKTNLKPQKRSYPPFWDKFIPGAVILITAIIAVLVFITIRVALGLAALPF
jgi:hypothetical protein